MSIKVANLANLFWDNGSFKYPNTYPRLINGNVVNKTPVMTSPISGWVILEGEWNYCEFNGDLFFLKRSEVISHKRDKWRYILIKDHICTLFKNKGDVQASGTLINTNVNNLGTKDYQFVFAPLNNYSKRILVPLAEEPFKWNKHSTIVPITKKFDEYCVWTDEDFSNFVTVLEANRDAFTKGPDTTWNEIIKENGYLVLLGRLSNCSDKKIKGWKNELVEKINEFLEQIRLRDDIVAGVISNSVMTKAKKLNGRYAISYLKDNPVFTTIVETRELTIDLSGLTDIQLINFDTPTSQERYSKDDFNFFLQYDINKVSRKYRTPEEEQITYVKKLSKRVRTPVFNRYTSRGIRQQGSKLYSWYFDVSETGIDWEMFLPQKIFIKGARPMVPKEGVSKYINYPKERLGDENYRSVYLYWWFDWNCFWVWQYPDWLRIKPFHYKTTTWIKAEEYFKDETKQNALRTIAGDVGYTADVYLWAVKEMDYYSSYYPWSSINEPINIGWLLGQFSMFISGQENIFFKEFPYIVNTGLSGDGAKLKRLKGFKDVVGELVHSEDLYDTKGFQHKYTLDCFNYFSHRQRESVKEEDFLIGEKLLFTTWGMASYLLFQPATVTWEVKPWYYHIGTVGTLGATALLPYDRKTTGQEAAYFNYVDVDDYYNSQLFGKWIEQASYQYSYTVFDYGHYFKQHAKEWYKKAYDGFKALDYERFYSETSKYRVLKNHIEHNTMAYFETEEVDLRNTPIRELKVNDVFYSDYEWFWFDSSGIAGDLEEKKFKKPFPNECIQLLPDRDMYGSNSLKDGEVVCYLHPVDKKIYLGRVYGWDSIMDLPANQYIATSMEDVSSNKNKLKIRYTRISPASIDIVSREAIGHQTLDELISVLKGAHYFKQPQPKDLKQLQDSGRDYLFDLKGTPMLCLFDRNGRVSLIYKNTEVYEDSEFIPD